MKSYLGAEVEIHSFSTRAILNDKAIYGTDTEIFNPERWLKDGKLNPAVPDPDFAFGFGRRICPGTVHAPVLYAPLVYICLTAHRQRHGTIIHMDRSSIDFGHF